MDFHCQILTAALFFISLGYNQYYENLEKQAMGGEEEEETFEATDMTGYSEKRDLEEFDESSRYGHTILKLISVTLHAEF